MKYSHFLISKLRTRVKELKYYGTDIKPNIQTNGIE
jgi:hypothetical protein